jgi:hypothetical protein
MHSGEYTTLETQWLGTYVTSSYTSPSDLEFVICSYAPYTIEFYSKIFGSYIMSRDSRPKANQTT